MKIRIKHILRCYQSGMSIRSISSSLLISRNTAKRYIHIYEDMGIELERLFKMDEQHLSELFCVNIDNESSRSAEYKYLEGRIPEYIKRLKSRGTTRRSLYEEYLKERPGGYSYCSFCLYLRREKEIRLPVGRIDHIAGDQMYVDFAGDKLYLSDENTGDKVPVEVFAAILPCSQIIYYEAVPSQKKEYLIQACENAFHYFGGVPNAIVPDNLKSAVTKPGGIEPVINDDFAAFADHYGCVVFPARVRKPKDKALVENAVRLLYREVYSKMTGLKFNDLEALNIEIMKHTDALNSRKMYNRSYSSKERFLEVEKNRLHNLPTTRFISKSRKMATVMRNSYVSLNNHYYSVPKEYIGNTVDLLYDADTIEIYYKFRHITTHRRDDTPFTYSEKNSHKLPGVLHEYRSRMEDIYHEAREIDTIVEEYIKIVAVAKKYPIQVVRSADGILRLVERFGHDRMVLACQIAMESNMFGYNELESILVNREDEKYHVQMEGQAPELTPKHRNLRGKDYFNSKNIDKNDK
ncbi:IS21 family transposase [Bacteroides nordii]|uniref:IS21 family transposase n=1 Tax=Bacteroides nordii TaxID=291645 RepID=UPI002493A812|nr:IS21 family transposase [Bacteroides nordii]